MTQRPETRKSVQYAGGRQLYVQNNDGQFVPISVKLPGPKPKYPLHKLSVGQSFFVPLNDPKKRTPIRGIYQRARNMEIKVRQRVMTENGVPGVRVWRIE